MKRAVARACGLLLTATLFAQQPTSTSKLIPIPADRAADSSAIYSLLLTPDEPKGDGWPLYLIENATTTVPKNKSCRPQARDSNGFYQDPHSAIHAPRERLQDFHEMLDDFDGHCHDSILITQDALKIATPFRLLNSVGREKCAADILERNNGVKAKRPPSEECAGGKVLLSLSEVYFNHDHPVAMVHSGWWCGLLCGDWRWIVLEHKDGKWRKLDWQVDVTLS